MAAPELVQVAIAILLGVSAASSIVYVDSRNLTGTNCDRPESGSTPLGAALAFGTVFETAVGGGHWYNATVETATPEPLVDFIFQVVNVSWIPISPGSGWTLNVQNSSGHAVDATFFHSALSDNWTTISPHSLRSGEVFTLWTTTSNIGGLGYSWFLLSRGQTPGGCPYGSETLISIP